MSEQKLIRFPQESVIIREGEINREMYKIIGGHAEMYTGYGTNLVNFLGIPYYHRFLGKSDKLLFVHIISLKDQMCPDSSSS